MTRGRRFAAAVSVAAAAPFSAGAADIVEIDWGTQQRVEQTLTVEPRAIAELCGRLPAKARVDWRFEADAPLDFNIHFHVGKEVRYPAKQGATRASSGALLASSAQDYCWMWSNDGTGRSAVRVVLEKR